MSSPKIYFGVDVAKASLVLAGPGFHRQFPNTAPGHGQLLAALPAHGHVVLEATGGYERALALALHNAARAVSVINPRQARDFARAKGRRAKTDPIDALELADYGTKLTPPPDVPPSKTQQELWELSSRRSQLIATRTAEQNRFDHLGLKRLRAQAQTLIRQFTRQIEQLDSWIAQLIQADPALQAKAQRLQEVEGVGPVVSSILLAHVPELGSLTSRQAAHLFGLAPFNADSGQSHGRRHIAGGRAIPRSALYMATLTATMRKLACLLNTLLKNPHFLLAP